MCAAERAFEKRDQPTEEVENGPPPNLPEPPSMRFQVVEIVAVIETTEPIQPTASNVRGVGAHDGQGC
jgi:hypothetical protein